MPKRKSDATEGDALGSGHGSPGGPAEAGRPSDAASPYPATPPDLTTPAEPEAVLEPEVAAEVSPPEPGAIPDLTSPVEAEAEPYPAPAGPEPLGEPFPEPTLASPDVAAEPGSPDPVEPPAPPADPGATADAYQEPHIVGAATADREHPRPSAAEVADEGHDDEGGMSFAGKVLAALVLLAAGGALALWAGPKIAPSLPAGMSGVAAWLSPGSADAEARIAALEERLGMRVGDLEARLGEMAGRDEIGTAVEAATTRLDGEIAALKQSVAEADDSTGAEALARIRSSLDGQAAELATLKEQLAAAPAATGPDASRIDVYEAGLEGLRAEVGGLQERVAGLTARVDEAVLDARAEIDAARTRVGELEAEATTQVSAAQAGADRAAIEAAVASGAPFEPAVRSLGGESGSTVPQALLDAAATGVPTMTTLREDFPEAAHAAIRASVMASAGDGVLARTRAFFEAQVASRSLSPREGSTPDAILSRVEDDLKRDDLGGALAEADALPSEAKAAMAGWLDAARKRAAVLDGLATLDAPAPATN